MDGTVGYGGHAAELLSGLTQGMLIGLDRDATAIQHSGKRFENIPCVKLVQANYDEFPRVLETLNIPKVSKILLDLGVSSLQIDQPGRGFSFQKDGPLDMRMSSEGVSAEDILNTYTESELMRIFTEWGDLRYPQKLVTNLLNARTQGLPKTTLELVQIIKKSFFFKNQRSLFMKTCSQVFQSLRMEVNQEMAHLTQCLEQIPLYMKPGGRLAIITFHSIEDRMVKTFFKARKDSFVPVTKKVISATYAQAGINPRAKSAKLRLLSYQPIEA